MIPSTVGRPSLNRSMRAQTSPAVAVQTWVTISAMAAVADAKGVPRAQVALAWVLAQPGVDAPIIGATKPHHISDAVAALEVELSDDEVTRLEEHYTSRPQVGFR